jgi:DNA-binding CsgD family transcriptional regulator
VAKTIGLARTIVGRERELAAVVQFLDLTSAEACALVIDGEAGIGKTTIWREAVRLARERAFWVLEARPAQSEAKLSYAGLADLIGTVFEETRTVLPPVQQRGLAAALLRGDADETADPRATATGLVGILSALAAEAPVAVAIDDLHWLDPASQQALAFAVRRLPARVGLLLTRRVEREEPLPLGLERALTPERVDSVAPGPLSLAALHHLLRDTLGTSLPRPLLTRVAAVSGGNPFFAIEIARALVAASGDRAAGEPLAIPRNLEELVADRVHGLSEAARRAALVAAALSRPTATAVTEAFAAEGDGRAALLEAEEAGVLVFEQDRVRFAHPLLASVIYGSASVQRRRLVHERLATVVGDREERARHLALSTSKPDEAVAAELEHAGTQAANRGAPQAAAELFEAARRLTPMGGLEELTRRALGQASALLAAGDVEGAGTIAQHEAGSPVAALRAQALYLLAEVAWISGTSSPREFFEAALAAAPEDRDLAARIYPKLVSFTTHDPTRSVAYAEAAMQRLSPARHPAALAQVAFDCFWAELGLGHGPRWELFGQWRALEVKAGPEAPKTPLPLIFFGAIDDFDEARARYVVEEQWYRERGEDLWRAERLAHLSVAQLRAGRWDVAERSVEEACDVLAEHLGKPGPWGAAFRIRSLIDAHRGQTARARATLVPFIETAERAGLATWEALGLSTLALIDFVDGDHRGVDQSLARMRQRLESMGFREFAPDRSEPFHIESLVALGELDRARGVLARLEERGRVFPRLWITVTLPRAWALVLAAEGDAGAALAALDGLDLEAASKLPFELGWTLLVRGRLHRRVRQKRAAADALAASLAIFEQIGATPWGANAQAELGRVGLRRAPDQLTATERRVAELAAAGLTNREVASRAFMSPKTVQANLARVYRKLGISSRAELGARMANERAPDTQT